MQKSSMAWQSALRDVKEKLADFKKPRQVVFLKELPKNTAEKILKYRLKELA